MDPSALDSGMIGPFVIAMLGAAVITWFMMLGGSLKMSLGLMVDEPPGYLRCLVMAVLIVIINIAVFVGFYITFGPQPWYIITCYQVMLQVILMIVVARVNPFAAALAAFCHSLFSGIGTVVIVLVLFFTCRSTVMSWKERTSEPAQQHDQQPVSSVVNSNPFVE